MELSTLASKTLEVTVWDYDIGKSNDFIGEGGARWVVLMEGSPAESPALTLPASTAPRWRGPGAGRPERGPEALERLSAAAGRSPGALAHLDQPVAPGSWSPALSLSRTAATQHSALRAGPSRRPSHECVARLHGVEAPPRTTCLVL